MMRGSMLQRFYIVLTDPEGLSKRPAVGSELLQSSLKVSRVPVDIY
jgi:hypothetical protein